jgi:hypothetical protein
MIRTLLVASSALAVVAAVALATQPVEAACGVATAKARGLDEASVSARSADKLTRKINHWAHKNDLSVVKVGPTATSCTDKGALTVCTSTARVCG